ncbi:MAG: hypothetical protein SOV71_03770 [Anaerovoracaceae bacterium]|nr:hypothetical protein [Anaerovoracaceae bacterium]
MAQGIVGAFAIRIPAALLISGHTSRLFYIGLATPCSTIVQIIMCLVMFVYIRKKFSAKKQ